MDVLGLQLLATGGPVAALRNLRPNPIAPDTPADLCTIDPGHDIDLLVTADLRAMTSAWMGMSDFGAELRAGRIELEGDRTLAASFTQWIGRSGLAARQ